jgi:hypothetical protein
VPGLVFGNVILMPFGAIALEHPTCLREARAETSRKQLGETMLPLAVASPVLGHYVWSLHLPTFQPTEEFYRRFNIANRLDTLAARYNIAPSQMVPVIISQSPNQVVLMRWGLISHWAKEEKTAYKMINARVETIAQRPAFRSLGFQEQSPETLRYARSDCE